jgi:hypothetical protein
MRETVCDAGHKLKKNLKADKECTMGTGRAVNVSNTGRNSCCIASGGLARLVPATPKQRMPSNCR